MSEEAWGVHWGGVITAYKSWWHPADVAVIAHECFSAAVPGIPAISVQFSTSSKMPPPPPRRLNPKPRKVKERELEVA